MRIIEPSVEYVGGNVSANDRSKHVELCGRVCYKSENKITENSAHDFIARIIRSGHEAVLEHARVTMDLTFLGSAFEYIRDVCLRMKLNGIDSHITLSACADEHNKHKEYYASGNMRAWRDFSHFVVSNRIPVSAIISRMWCENADFFPEFVSGNKKCTPYIGIDINPDDPHFMEDFPEYKIFHKWYTLRFICDRGVSHEIVRHRIASYCQESTRYCNYSKNDFDGQITVVKPACIEKGTYEYGLWRDTCEAAETAYFDLLDHDYFPQDARCVLPTCLKTELIMTATADEWIHFFKLRTMQGAHPEMRRIATQARGILEKIDPETNWRGQ